LDSTSPHARLRQAAPGRLAPPQGPARAHPRSRRVLRCPSRHSRSSPMPPPSHDELLNERSQQLLKLLVEHYIRDGQPVGSRTLSRDLGLTLSAATIRNVMADLEELGFVTSPHTSAGRIPTDKGYRFFVDTLLRVEPPTSDKIAAIQSRLGQHADDPKALVAAASQMLSSVTRLAGVVTLPRQSHAALSQIEFVPLSDQRVLAILVVNGREVQYRILQLDRDFNADQLRRASNYLNQQFAGKQLQQVRDHLLTQLQQTREDLNEVMQDAIRLAQHLVEPASAGRAEYVMAGETNLMGFAE